VRQEVFECSIRFRIQQSLATRLCQHAGAIIPVGWSVFCDGFLALARCFLPWASHFLCPQWRSRPRLPIVVRAGLMLNDFAGRSSVVKIVCGNALETTKASSPRRANVRSHSREKEKGVGNQRISDENTSYTSSGWPGVGLPFLSMILKVGKKC
jgi:hypothetical protein